VLQFKDLQLEDKNVIDGFLGQDPPRISELTFTNLFMWRLKYRPVWAVHTDCLLIILHSEDGSSFGLQPVGTGDKAEALDALATAISRASSEVVISRVDETFVENFVDRRRYQARADRDNSDYVYLANDLIALSGNRFHKKKNHLNKFLKTYSFEYRSLDRQVVRSCLDLQNNWCQLKNCESNDALQKEDRAVYEALNHHAELGFSGGAILIDGKVDAFSLGEKLNADTAVIHVEKANPEIPDLYAAINQQFCQNEWSDVTYINRQQDLGVPGIRKAKKSYHPDHMVAKFVVTLK
jgi:hypothetical protein